MREKLMRNKQNNHFLPKKPKPNKTPGGIYLSKTGRPMCFDCHEEMIPDGTALNFVTLEWDGHTFICGKGCMGGARLSVG